MEARERDAGYAAFAYPHLPAHSGRRLAQGLGWYTTVLGLHAAVIAAFLATPSPPPQPLEPPQPVITIALLEPELPAPAMAPQPEPPPEPPQVITPPEPTPPPPKPVAAKPSKPKPQEQPRKPPERKVANREPAISKPSTPVAIAPTPSPPHAAAAHSSTAEQVIPPDLNAAYRTNPKPPYPGISKKRGEQGRVFLRVHISETGMPVTVQVARSCGYIHLDEAARKAVSGWTFKPARKGGKPIAMTVTVPIAFRLNES